jgi:glycogen debranching enzyme
MPSCGCWTPGTSAATRGCAGACCRARPAEQAFEPHNYWRGPVWPVIDWLLWRSLRLLGYSDRADELRRDSLGQIAAAGDFAEYFEPFTGKPLGSPQQSWTAAVTLDWMAAVTPD